MTPPNAPSVAPAARGEPAAHVDGDILNDRQLRQLERGNMIAARRAQRLARPATTAPPSCSA
jgi:hypothetical protein